MVQIGTIRSVGHAENYNYEFDDRQEIVKTVKGAVVVDPWGGSKVADGDVVSFAATFSTANANTIRGWWASRTKQTVVLTSDWYKRYKTENVYDLCVEEINKFIE